MQIAPTEMARLMRAAALECISLEDFILRNALIAADAVIEKSEHLTLDEEQVRFMVDLLDDPPEPNARLLAAARAVSSHG